MDSAEPLSSILWTLTPHPGESLRRDIGLPRVCCPFCQLNSGAGRSSPVRNLVSCLCSGRYRTRFRRFRWVLGRSFFIIGGMDCSFLRLRGILLWSFVGFALTAVESFVLAENGMEYLSFSSPNRTNAFSNMVLPSLFGEMDLHGQNWHHFAVSGNPKNVR